MQRLFPLTAETFPETFTLDNCAVNAKHYTISNIRESNFESQLRLESYHHSTEMNARA